jgi:CRISPR/Cas system-associated endonuclease/helicase Cas3
VASEHRYQLEVLEKASKENIILYLETGGGKTLIAVLLMKSLAHNLRLKGDKRIAVFLVPTVILVHQQLKVPFEEHSLKNACVHGFVTEIS